MNPINYIKVLFKYLNAHAVLASLLISLIPTVIAIRSCQMAQQAQHFEYAVRLQILEEEAYIAELSKAFGKAFVYSAKIQNMGDKPVEIIGTLLDYGSEQDPKKRWHIIGEGDFYLRPGDYRTTKFILPQSDIEEIVKELKIDRCMFFLRVLYMSNVGKKAEALRLIGGYEGSTFIMIDNKFSILTLNP